ncbi:hypothetical protein PuT2_14350 [Pusillimonas sp. T2]|uniref:hypothetical protein n=1 Tax=Pusillimonas sp. T2 TaxID=1548123 RepID=UPI000B9C9DE6|nr:hypothetical protein [Pusillimonas sp. T2]OXR48111.1 hypothetical protein PuT2_14350 [Pusillimonas sp. T2]
MRDAILAASAKEREGALARLQQGRERSVELMDQAGRLTDDASRAQAFDRVKALSAADQKATDDIVQLVRNAPLGQDGALLMFLRESVVQPSNQVGSAMSELTSAFEAH